MRQTNDGRDRRKLIEDIQAPKERAGIDVRTPGTNFRSIGSLDEQYLHQRTLKGSSAAAATHQAPVFNYTRIPPMALLDAEAFFNDTTIFDSLRAGFTRGASILAAASVAVYELTCAQLRWVRRFMAPKLRASSALVTGFASGLMTPSRWFRQPYRIGSRSVSSVGNRRQWATLLILLAGTAALFSVAVLTENSRDNSGNRQAAPGAASASLSASERAQAASANGNTSGGAATASTSAGNSNGSSAGGATGSPITNGGGTSTGPTSGGNTPGIPGVTTPFPVTVPPESVQAGGKQVIGTSGSTVTLN